MLKEGVVPFEDLKFIWNKGMSKHESVKRVVFQIWTDLVTVAG